MRAGLSTIQQTLTPEAATVLNQSIAEASRRNHGQTTPLHVAATLLASPSGYLRQACIRSHPNSSHPLQCRALELCFSVALERLPTAQNTASTEPPISNALMAALKRAQAHQRRGCPEQQQQPLLAVKVELDQFIISILDDPSVSRVMREASFSSPAVKATIEQSVNTSSAAHGHHVNFGPRLVQIPSPVLQLANRNIYLNPRLQQRGNEVNKIIEIMGRSKKRNPVLVGDSEPQAVVRELLSKIGSDGVLKNAKVISIERGLSCLSDKKEIPMKIKELGCVIEGMIKSGGVIVDLGDLKWLVEQAQPLVLEIGRAAVVEMAELLARFRGDGDDEKKHNRLWLIGTATCETYMRCQVYHSTMENDWDVKAVSMASPSPPPGFFPRIGTERLLSNPVEPITPLPGLTTRVFENNDHARKNTFCPQCSENYEKELTQLTATEKSFSESKQEATQPSLPQWLQSAKLNTTNPKTADQSSQGNKDHGLLSKHKAQELENKWRDTCLHLHPTFHRSTRANIPSPPTLSMTSVYDPNPLRHPIFQHNLQPNKPPGEALQLNANQFITNQQARLTNNSPPGSPVRTDLVLGRKGAETQSKDLFGCISSEKQNKLVDKFANGLDADIYRKLLKGLMEKAWWQGEAASAVASAITRCRLGNGKSRGGGSRGDIWLLFAGPDRVGKKKIALVLAEQICGSGPIMIRLGKRKEDQEPDVTWGKTAIDRITEAVRRNPFSVIMLEDIDEAEMHVREIKQAIERGKLTDSHGREVSLGNAIFILTGDWSSSNNLRDGNFVDEKKLASIASTNWQLGLVVREKSNKRRPNWLDNEDRSTKLRKELEPVSLDLNLASFDTEDDKTDGSDVTVDHDLVNQQRFSITSVPQDLLDNVDDAIVFKPVDSASVRREIKKTISLKFSKMVEDDDKLSVEVEDDVLEKILGGLWHDRTSLGDWVEKVVAPSFDRLKQRLLSDDDRGGSVVRLVVESDSGGLDKSNGGGDWLPSSILV